MKVNMTKFAELIGKSGQYVSLLIDQGLPAERSGKRGQQVFLDTAKAIAWLLARERQKVEDEIAPDGTKVGAETKRLRAAQAQIAELEAAERRRELVVMEDVRQVVMAAGVVFAQQLDALPGRMANEMAACSDPAIAHAKLRDECRRIRQATAQEFARIEVAVE